MSLKILVAGGAGFIGSVMVPRLVERGYDVTVVDLLWFGNKLPNSVPLLQRNVMDLKGEDLKGFDVVIFLAGLSNDPMAEFSPARNFLENGAGPAYLAYLAKQAGVKRFIHGGSCSVYGYTVNELYDETSPAVCAYPYGISKLQGEAGAMQMADDGFSVIGFRQGTVCGYSPRMRLDLVLNTMFKSGMTERVIRVNNPSIWRPILAIQDAAAAYVRAVEAAPGISGVFNIASGNYTIGELADYVREGIQEHLGITASIDVKHVSDLRNYKVSTQKAETLLSFKPRHHAETIVRELATNWDRFKNTDLDDYYNIRMFRKLTA